MTRIERVEATKTKESVRHLQVLYSAVVGLGLALAMATFIEVGNRGVEVAWRASPILAAYVIILVPFYHGAQRHLDDAYLFGHAERRGHGGLLLADFGILFIESCLLFALAAFLKEPRSFGWSLLILLSVDTMWGAVFYRVTAGRMSGSAELGWAKVNALTVAALLIILLLSHKGQYQILSDQLPFGLVLLAVSLARTVGDYAKTWDFYFPHT